MNKETILKQAVLAIAIFLIAIWLMCGYWLFFLKKTKPTPPPKQIKSEREIIIERDNELQGIAISRLMKELDDLRHQEVHVQVRYKTVYKEVHAEAPDTCQPYIDRVKLAADSVIAAKDSTIEKQAELIGAGTEQNATKDSLIVEVKAGRERETKRADDAEKQTEKANKRGKIAAWAVGIGMAVIWVVTSVID